MLPEKMIQAKLNLIVTKSRMQFKHIASKILVAALSVQVQSDFRVFGSSPLLGRYKTGNRQQIYAPGWGTEGPNYIKNFQRVQKKCVPQILRRTDRLLSFHCNFSI
jgi:hypothetical protein